MKLNARHQALLMHRLSAGVIPEVLADSDLGISVDDAITAQAHVCFMVGTTELDIAQLNRVQREVLKDCLDGATYFAGYEDAIALKERTRGDFLADSRAANELEEEFFKATGEKVSFIRG